MRAVSVQRSMVIALAIFSGVGAYATGGDERSRELSIIVHQFQGDPNKQKGIFVFLDGTENRANSTTNVWQLYELLLGNDDAQMTAAYIEGVGSAEDAPIVDAVLGHGMEQRILDAYRFVSVNYKPGDEIYLFGFSRGAHQARALAGLISYAGIPETFDKGSDGGLEVLNQILETVKKVSDEDFRERWIAWRPDQPPLLATEIRDRLDIDMQTATVEFLGVWDTVPGSSLKSYGICKEEKGFVKNYLYWLIPGIDRGERYKTDSYPPIRRIAHAVSLDEKRSKFAPLLLCKELSAKHTRIREVWFPGSHADVGGGYKDSTELPFISLKWMMGLLSEVYELATVPQEGGNVMGLAHWSIGDRPANWGSRCIDRVPPAGAEIHASVEERKKASPVPIQWEGKQELLNYPISCPTL